MKRTYKKKSNLVNNTGYTPGYSTEGNSMNIIPNENITMSNTPYPVYGQPLNQNGQPIGQGMVMQPGQEYRFGGASYVAETPMFKKGGTKESWVGHKIGILMREGYPQKQAIAIAYSMYEQKHADGGTQDELVGSTEDPGYPYLGNNVFGNMPNNFPVATDPSLVEQPTTETFPKPDPAAFEMPDLTGLHPEQDKAAAQNLNDWNKKEADMYASDYNKATSSAKSPEQTRQDIESGRHLHQFVNPYGGIDMGTSLIGLGKSVESGDKLGMAAYGANTLLTGAKSFLQGMGMQNRVQSNMQDYYKNQRKNMTGEGRETAMKFGGYYQDGGMDKVIDYQPDPNDMTDAEAAKFMEMYNRDNRIATPTFDPNSARDTWEQKTGMSWDQAKKLGYTDGSAKGNTKLLSELNDPRFKKENLRKPTSGKTTVAPKEDNTIYQGGQLKEVIVKGKKKSNYVDPYKGWYNDSEGDLRNNKGIMVGLDGQPLNFMERNFMSSGIMLPPKNTEGVRMKPLGFNPTVEEANAYHKAQYENKLAADKARAQRAAAQQAQRVALWGESPKPFGFFEEGGETGDTDTDDLDDLSMSKRLALLDQAISKGLNISDYQSPESEEKEMKKGGCYQEGGEQPQNNQEQQSMEQGQGGPQDQIQQIVAQVVGMLQQGMDPQQVLQQLVQSGMPQDQAAQIIQAAMQQSQGATQGTPQLGKGGYYQAGGMQAPQEEQMEGPASNAQEEQGEQPMNQEQVQGIMNQVAQALQQGADPQQLLQQLVQSGLTQQQATQILQMVIQQLQQQGHNAQEEGAEGGKMNPQEEGMEQGQPMMKMGGNFFSELKGKTIKNYTYNAKTDCYEVEYE